MYTKVHTAFKYYGNGQVITEDMVRYGYFKL